MRAKLADGGGRVALRGWRFWWLVALGSLGLTLLFADIVLVESNFELQARFEQRARYVRESQRLEGVYLEARQALADLSRERDDDRLKELLAAHPTAAGALPVSSPENPRSP